MGGWGRGVHSIFTVQQWAPSCFWHRWSCCSHLHHCIKLHGNTAAGTLSCMQSLCRLALKYEEINILLEKTKLAKTLLLFQDTPYTRGWPNLVGILWKVKEFKLKILCFRTFIPWWGAQLTLATCNISFLQASRNSICKLHY